MGYDNLGEELSIIECEDDGLKITLSDGSKWDIQTGDIGKTACWYETQKVRVEANSDNNIYPYKLINMSTAGPDEANASLT